MDGRRPLPMVGHDRGVRVGYRLALDPPGAVMARASLAVVPALAAMAAINYRTAAKAFHCFLFAPKGGLARVLAGGSPGRLH